MITEMSKEEVDRILRREEKLTRENFSVEVKDEVVLAKDYHIPKEYLTVEGDFDYLQIGKMLLERDDYLHQLKKENEKKYSGDSFYAKWRRKKSEQRKTGIKEKIENLEERVNTANLQRVPVLGDFVLSYSHNFDGPFFEVYYTNFDDQGKLEFIMVRKSTDFGSATEIRIRPTVSYRIACVLKPNKFLNEEDIINIKTKCHSLRLHEPIQPFPVLVQNYDKTTSIFGTIFSIGRYGFEVDGANCSFNYLEKGKITVQKLIPVFKEPERSQTYRTF